MTGQVRESDDGFLMNYSLPAAAGALLALSLLAQCARKPLLPDYTPLCTGMTPGTHPSRSPLSAQDPRQYRVGPKGGVYYVNSHNKKVYIKSMRKQ